MDLLFDLMVSTVHMVPCALSWRETVLMAPRDYGGKVYLKRSGVTEIWAKPQKSGWEFARPQQAVGTKNPYTIGLPQVESVQQDTEGWALRLSQSQGSAWSGYLRFMKPYLAPLFAQCGRGFCRVVGSVCVPGSQLWCGTFYPLTALMHRAGAYTYLKNDDNKEMLKWSKIFEYRYHSSVNLLNILISMLMDGLYSTLEDVDVIHLLPVIYP
ncbi:hypothetical protein L484_005488 [Morus notabilis]|uniref:Uncharacterized protein n=1 Tax=Morus notabilis TaxID=981085 RepID=W9QC05_9ROSA|nr:hypothetical protein L484_005488 [Morus notabilis]